MSKTILNRPNGWVKRPGRAYNIFMADITLRTIFNSAASEYDAIRPGYPDALIEDVITLSSLPENPRLLEIGCGTGQATRSFAPRGYEILCLDIGPDLIARAQENLRAFPRVRFENVSFENWEAEPQPFDLVYSATAFHWIPPAVGYPKAAHVLRPGGTLAVFSNEHPYIYTGFFDEVQAVYNRLVPEWQVEGKPAPARLHTNDEIHAEAAFIDSMGLFAPVIVRTYPWKRTYTTAEYLILLNTYSNHRNLEEPRRQTLYQSIADLIERRYGGRVEKEYLGVLFLARKGD